jgi:hypothetical protein
MVQQDQPDQSRCEARPPGHPPDTPVTKPAELTGDDPGTGREREDVTLSTERKRAILERETFAILMELQRQGEREGTTPASPLLVLRRYASYFEYIGGIFLGILLGVMVLLFNFILFNKFLHLQF